MNRIPAAALAFGAIALVALYVAFAPFLSDAQRKCEEQHSASTCRALLR